MKTLYPQLRITDSNFNYTSAAKTDIRETFKRARESLGGQDNNKPLVEPTLNPEGFVLPAEWFQVME
jgi:hypothetical protein